MSSIVGIVGQGEIAPLLVESMARLEYRGYDSCGVATLNSSAIEVRKDVGPVQEVLLRQALDLAEGAIGIAHTRWATHGGVSQENAHPHLSCDKSFAVVHNGIISNYRALREELQAQGHHFFFSETDTEVFAHLLEETYQPGVSVEEAFIKALRRLEGTFAIAMISTYEPRRIFCAREKSPLILGIASAATFVRSDINAFLPYTRQTILLDDGEYAMLSKESYCVRGIRDGEMKSKKLMEIQWHTESNGKAGYRHYMEKEIEEQPDVIRRAMEVPQKDIDSLARSIREAQRN